MRIRIKLETYLDVESVKEAAQEALYLLRDPNAPAYLRVSEEGGRPLCAIQIHHHRPYDEHFRTEDEPTEEPPMP